MPTVRLAVAVAVVVLLVLGGTVSTASAASTTVRDRFSGSQISGTMTVTFNLVSQSDLRVRTVLRYRGRAPLTILQGCWESYCEMDQCVRSSGLRDRRGGDRRRIPAFTGNNRGRLRLRRSGRITTVTCTSRARPTLRNGEPLPIRYGTVGVYIPGRFFALHTGRVPVS